MRRLHSAWQLRLVMYVTLVAFAPSMALSQEVPSPADHVISIKDKAQAMRLIEKSSRILQFESRIRDVSGFDPAVLKISAVPGDASRIRVMGIAEGLTTITIVDEFDKPYSIEVLVSGDVKLLEAKIRNSFPDSAVRAEKVKDAVLLQGWVSQPDHLTTIVEMAEMFFPRVLNSLKVSGHQQVMLRVKIMEVQRSKIRAMGFNFLELSQNGFVASGIGGLAPISTVSAPLGAAPAVTVNPTNATAAFGVVNDTNSFTGFVEALKQESLLKILAEPNLLAVNGRPANFLNGGEFPIPVPQGLGTVSVQFRPFGVRLDFVPNILGNGRIRLDVTPEVSERDFSSTVTISGVTVPALTVRRCNTQVDMNFGETLIIAGLINNRIQARTNAVPFFGELPVVGAAFRRVNYDETETELLIMVTPEYAAPLPDGQGMEVGPGYNTVTPTDSELFLRGMKEVPRSAPDPDCDLCVPGQSLVPSDGYPGAIPGDVYYQDEYQREIPPQLTPPVVAPPAPENPATGQNSARGRSRTSGQISPAGATQRAVPPARRAASRSGLIQPTSATSTVPRTKSEATSRQRPGLIAP